MDKKEAHDDEVYKRCNPDLAAWAGFGLTNNLEALPPDLQPQIIGTHYGEGQRKALEAIFIHQEGAITKPQFEIPDCWLGEGWIPEAPPPIQRGMEDRAASPPHPPHTTHSHASSSS